MEKFKSFAENKESILERKEFSEVPENFVSVYHQVFDKSIPTIDNEGLKPLSDQKLEDIRGGEERIHQDQIIDSIRPEFLKEAGISRFNIFAYPVSPNIKTYFGSQTVVECKVDPKTSYVLEMTEYTESSYRLKNEISYLKTNGQEFDLDERIRIWFSHYWEKVASLEDFYKYYEFNNREDRFIRKNDAPDSLPKYFNEPEVLIPEAISQEHIRIAE